jgi:hypothetical protein
MGKSNLAPLAVAGSLLAGCAQSPPAYYYYQPQAYQPPPQAYYAPPAAPRPAPRLHAPVPDTEPAKPSPPKTETGTARPAPRVPSPPSADDCDGWWRICHFL